MDALEDGPAGVLVGGPEVVRRDQLEEQRDSSPFASCHCGIPAWNPGAAVGCELAGHRGIPCHLVSVAMLRACGVSIEGIQAGHGNAGAFRSAVGVCHSHPLRLRRQDHR